MKVIIPLASASTEKNRRAHPNPLLPVGGKPIIAHTIDKLLEENICDFIFVIDNHNPLLKKYINEHYKNQINTTFVIQNEPKGLGHAVWATRENIKEEEEILIILGDIIFESSLSNILTTNCNTLGIYNVKTPCDFGIVVFEEDQITLKSAVEKPRIPTSNNAIAGIYKISNPAVLLEVLEELVVMNQLTHGKIQLTDALNHMIVKGYKFKGFPIDTWYDCSQKDILLNTNATLLQKTPYREIPLFENTIIIHPVSIGNNCCISDAIIGPNVSIGEDTHIASSIVRNTIIGNNSTLMEVVLHDAIIGNNTQVNGIRQSFHLGDDAIIDFGH